MFTVSGAVISIKVIIVLAMTLVVGAIFLRDTKDVDIRTGSGVADMAKS